MVSLANKLGVSLDTLFDNNDTNLEDISSKIVNTLCTAPKEKIFEIAYDICWQIELGLFSYLNPKKMNSDHINKIKQLHSSSYVVNDFGFTVLNNGKAPFFSLFSNSDFNLSESLGNGEDIYNIFKHLASFDTVKAILYLYKKDAVYLFDRALIQKECDICDENIVQVMEDLISLRIVIRHDIDINNENQTLFCYGSSPVLHKLMALFLMAIEYDYQSGHVLSGIKRMNPFLK